MDAGVRHEPPLTQLVNATRAFFLWPRTSSARSPTAGHFASRTLFWCAVFTAVFAPLAARCYRRG